MKTASAALLASRLLLLVPQGAAEEGAQRESCAAGQRADAVAVEAKRLQGAPQARRSLHWPAAAAARSPC